MSPLQLYDKRVEEGKLKDDPYQRKIITSLSKLHENLTAYHPPEVHIPTIAELTPKIGISKIFSSFFGKNDASPSPTQPFNPDSIERNPVKGIYLYGDVGCGKTMLMDLFYDTIPPHLSKTRVHFHNFMQNLHKRSHQLKIANKKQDIDVIPLLAAEIATESTVLCFDEMQVHDVADAMLLRRLLMILLMKHHIILFATSNRAPDELYLNGIQRASFIPCIQLIKAQCNVVYLLSDRDYRKLKMAKQTPTPLGSPFYFGQTHSDAEHEHIAKWWDYFAGKKNATPVKDYKISVWGRELTVPIAYPPKVGQFTFEEICGSPKSAGDYLSLAQELEGVIITDIPFIESRDELRRFITLIDALYDAHSRLAISCQFDFDHLVGIEKSSEEGFAYSRTVSRLSQMGTPEWIENGV
jgi:protein AFG1